MILDKRTVLEAAARGYCTPTNSHKELDAELLTAVVDEILRALAAEQPESPQQAVPAGCVECMQEASEVLSEERMPRGPLADELWGFSLMLRDNAAQATQQAVLDAYACCAEICKSKMADEIATGDVDHNENAWSFICERAILAARDALKDKP